MTRVPRRIFMSTNEKSTELVSVGDFKNTELFHGIFHGHKKAK